MTVKSLIGVAAAGVLGVWANLAGGTAAAAPVQVPNYSFENPTVDPGVPASPIVADWSTFDPTPLQIAPGVFINADDGVFPNTPPGSPDRFSNADGNQLAFIGAEAGNAFFQQLPATFQAGQAYDLTVGVGRSFGQQPAAAASLRLALYYQDGDVRREVASTAVFNSPENALSPNLLKDFGTSTGLLSPTDPAVGRPIGILLTTTGPAGGFFDMDNVRLNAVPEPGGLGVLAAGVGLLAGRRRKRRAG